MQEVVEKGKKGGRDMKGIAIEIGLCSPDEFLIGIARDNGIDEDRREFSELSFGLLFFKVSFLKFKGIIS
ncbi:MAG: hypothetical protein LLF93_03140 [Bacteroidales bacterium]|nr:hypothetical protein [Bacteroidales bacterium]